MSYINNVIIEIKHDLWIAYSFTMKFRWFQYILSASHIIHASYRLLTNSTDQKSFANLGLRGAGQINFII